jgi:YidC/Oxa1 family membrane protein insertase
MEEKKLDVNSIIGFVLIFGILIYMFYINQPTAEELAEMQQQEQVEKEQSPLKEQPDAATTDYKTESIATDQVQETQQLGAFKLAGSTFATSTIANDKISLELSHKGGQLQSVQLIEYNTSKEEPVYLIKDDNSTFDIEFTDRENRIIHTKDLLFELVSSSDTALKLQSKLSDNQYIEFNYALSNKDYMVDFSVRSQGVAPLINPSNNPKLSWTMDAIRLSKSVMYENRYTRTVYRHEDDKVGKLSQGGSDDEVGEDVQWISYKQHFFSSILIPQNNFDSVSFNSETLAEEESEEAAFTKRFSSNTELSYTANEFLNQFRWYFGPTDVKVLSQYENLELESSIPFGWGIFGWLNRYVFTPVYTFLSSFLPFGIAIIVMTILVRLLMSPVTYKSYLSQAKMKVLRPEIDEINEKFKDNAMKKQQETMALYSKAGVNPMSGCIPALLQMPIFYALFMFFPSAFVLRQKSFLWAEDLSSYDTVMQLPFKIPFYGDHVSLFPLLASIAIFFYMKMTTGQNMPSQPGMPNMKFILYLSPVMMLFFFNSYASGLSLYYFVSNLITILIMLVIKNKIIDEDKIHARIQENKKKPKKKSKFQERMKEMMEQAEQQKKNK